ncbi:universal stress protein [Cytobacillus gottheilii]|uniref:Universal stress protein n=1 Tax=Cytobacillus gottheilii TaxID=859144 RepID=A0ABX8FB32_9BACI|nr:universal stress protein [Cytobacillus gottheilii]QVY60671.1 universal stress protein [Cytobacillus gottheilii]
MAMNYENILVAVDGSPEADWAFRKAIEIAKRNNAKIIVAHIVDTRTYANVEAYDRGSADRANEYAEELMEKYRQAALEAGVNEVTYEIDFGSPKVKVPKEMAKNHNVDLIICGATGMNAVERFLIGSVSEHITRYAECDVLVVRTKKESE